MFLEVDHLVMGPEAKMSHWPAWTWTTGFGFRSFLCHYSAWSLPWAAGTTGWLSAPLWWTPCPSLERWWAPGWSAKWPRGDQELCPLISSRRGLNWPARVCDLSIWQLLIVSGPHEAMESCRLWDTQGHRPTSLGREVFTRMSQDSDEPTLTGLLFHKLLVKRKEPNPNSKPWPTTIVRTMLCIKLSKLGRVQEIAHMLMKSLLLLASDVSSRVWIWF